MKTLAITSALLVLTFFTSQAQTTGNNNYVLLPENLAFFTAERIRNIVSLQWQTVNEQNSKGFTVQRKTNGGWEDVTFLRSNSGGNSSARVSYGYTEINNFRGVTQYRVAEVTNEGKHRWSEIKAVRSETQTGKLILYPNPSADGRVSLMFEKSAKRNIDVSNIMGHPVRQYKNTTNTNLVIENLQPGFYSLRITDCATGETYVEKVIVAKDL